MALAAATAERSGSWRVRIVAAPRRTVAALVDVPAPGHTSVRPVALNSAGAVASGPAPVAVTGRTLDNGLLRVEVAADSWRPVARADRSACC